MTTGDFVNIPLPHGLFALIDADDAHLLTGQKWHLDRDGYVIRGGGRARLPTVRLHRVVMKAQRGQEVDHINGDKLDNRKENLRFVTRAQNTVNSPMRATNTTGYKGVRRNKGQYWAAFIRVNGKQRHLGHFATAEEAARAYDEAAFAEWGEFAHLNFPPIS